MRRILFPWFRVYKGFAPCAVRRTPIIHHSHTESAETAEESKKSYVKKRQDIPLCDPRHMILLIEEITNRIIKHMDPDRIILFGSHGSADQDQSSDIDLLVVKETDKRPLDRRIEVEKLLADRSCPVDVLVYTPEELRMLYAIGSPLIQEIMEKGRLLYMRKATLSWMQDAEEEFETAGILLEHRKYRGACYHSQQCVEKGLKALILEKGERPERSHDIIQLLNRVQGLGWKMDLDLDEAIFLNSIYKGRYPTEEGLLPQGEPSRKEASQAVATAEKLMAYLQKAI